MKVSLLKNQADGQPSFESHERTCCIEIKKNCTGMQRKVHEILRLVCGKFFLPYCKCYFIRHHTVQGYMLVNF